MRRLIDACNGVPEGRLRGMRSIFCTLFLAVVTILFPYVAKADSDRALLATMIDMCESGLETSCHDVAEFYYGDERKRYLNEAFNFYKKACNAGLGKSCRMIGKMYYEGDLGAGDDTSIALKFFDMACDNEDASGCFLVATMLRDGQGAAADPERSVGYFRQACEKGSAGGCDEWGMAHFSETGDEIVNAEALAAFEKGCVLKSGDACFHAGRLHYKGLVTPADHAKALDRYASACSFGKKEACEKASRMYAQGDGTEKNEEKAFLYARGMQDQSVVAPPSESKDAPRPAFSESLLPPHTFKKLFAIHPLSLIITPFLLGIFSLQTDFDIAIHPVVGVSVDSTILAGGGMFGLQLNIGVILNFQKKFIKGWFVEPYVLLGFLVSPSVHPIMGAGVIIGYTAIWNNGFVLKSGLGVEGGIMVVNVLGMIAPRLLLGLGYAW
mgnify:CR=1 FL=1